MSLQKTLFILIAGLMLSPFVAEPALAAETSNEHLARVIADRVSADRLKSGIEILTGEKPVLDGLYLSNRFTVANKDLVVSHLMRELSGLGYDPKIETPDKINRRVDIPVNVVAEIAGPPGAEIVEIVTHYDSASQIVVGADDNASGTQLNLELAAILKDVTSRKTIRFVFTDMEETGFHGVRYHVEQALKKGEKIAAALVIDTVGFHPGDKQFVLDMVTGNNRLSREVSNGILHQQAKYVDRNLGIFPITLGSNPHVADIGAYWEKGIPGVFYRENYEHWNEGYHTPRDHIAKVNFDYMASVVRHVSESVFALAEVTGARVPDEVMKEANARYEAVRNKNRLDGTDYVAEAKPISNLMKRLVRIKKAPILKRLFNNLKRVYTRVILKQDSSELQRHYLSDLRAAQDKGTLEAAEIFVRKWGVPAPLVPAGECSKIF